MELTELLEISLKHNASDLHLSPNLAPLLRVDGELNPLSGLEPLRPEKIKALINSAMDALQQDELEKTLEIDFAFEISSGSRFRVNAFRQAHGLAAVFRAIPKQSPTLNELNMPADFMRLLNLPNGLILLTGPTGSGKSTTLAAMVDFINTNHSSHIITIEDPVEFIHVSKRSLVSQRQVHRDTHSFASALRSSLREDPDVILLGEMRDLETIRLALTAAETGHLVMATLHTSSAPRAINRIIDVFPTGEKEMIRNMLSESLQAVICQTLLKKNGGGRVAALEIMYGTSAIKNLIREDRIAQMMTAMQTGSDVGMCTLDQYLQRLVAQGIIESQIAQDVATDKKIFTI